MQVELKFVSLVWMHRRQHNLNPPLSCIAFDGVKAGRDRTDLLIPLLLPFRNQVSISVAVLQ